ncbi:MAG: class I SAM-dependent methyltransferase [Planctomycetes bacterium]|nr:class I SAM-dependent methyltransferase [Planctomycetota bacterium]MCB9903621.1 class I SAM-dependent methyltransferase [Planctomycetota bacterium]
MEREQYEIMRRAEDRHWWYRGMARVTDGLLRARVGESESREVLDAGCGTGANLELLAPYGRVTGLDFSEDALEHCRARGAERLVRASVTELPFESASFDLVLSCDVLSEVGAPDDVRGLAEFARVLRPGGKLLLRLPAYAWLGGGRHDRAVLTRHRYGKAELRAKLGAAGFEVEVLSHVNALLFPLAACVRGLERVLPDREARAETSLPAGPVNALFSALLGAEAPLVRGAGLPFGLTLISLATKRGDAGS